MAYLVVAYPELLINSFDQIQYYRKENDKLYYDVIKPHFTLVFPVFNITETEFINEVKLQSAQFEKINFIIRCSTINKDFFSDYYHAFLVPDEGFSKIVKLHDKLYSGKLQSNLRFDIDFIPHIGIGNSLDGNACKKMVDEWNGNDFLISGQIKEMTIIEYENNTITELAKIQLK